MMKAKPINDPNRMYWCKVHAREATHERFGVPCCDPKLPGIKLPCQCIDITSALQLAKKLHNEKTAASRKDSDG